VSLILFKLFLQENFGKLMLSQPKSPKVPWYPILIFLIFSVCILGIGYLYFQKQETYLKAEKQNELNAIIALKIEQIISWRQERIDYAMTVMNDPFFAIPVKNFISGKAPAQLKRQILARMTALASYQYKSLALVDPQGNLKLAVPESSKPLNPYLQSLALRAMAARQVIFSDLYLDEGSRVMLSVLAPIVFINKNNERISVGAVLMKIEPYQFLYPLIKSWPTPSATGETELVRVDGDQVVFLNELRHRHNTPLALHYPLNSPDLLAAVFARGHKGIVAAQDYRGVPVLGAAGRIPDSNWLLVAKVDAGEVYAPLKKRYQELLFLLFALIATAGTSIAYFWRNQQIRFYRRQYEIEHERHALAQRYEYLTRFANDIILVADWNRRIIEANDLAVVSYGYTREELLQMQLVDLYPSDATGELEALLEHLGPQGGLIFETRQRRQDGTTFPVEVSFRLLEAGGESLFQGIIRDISNRKRAEEALRESEKELRYLASQLLSAQEIERKRISRELHDELGHALLALKLQLEAVVEQLLPQQVSLQQDIGKILGFMSATIEKVRRLYLDLSPGDLEDLGLTTALHSLIEDFAELQKKIKWNIAVDDVDGLFDLPMQIGIYRVVQEALTNIGKHARPERVSIAIKRLPGTVSFTITDDGVGFERNKVLTEKKTVGLLAMAERVKILGGVFGMKSGERRGTRISFTIPTASGEK
jgi:PAS domain S-box-containing protein